MPSKKITITCPHCKETKKVWGHANATFCSYQCSANHKRDVFIHQWLNEEINGVYKNTQNMHKKRLLKWYKENVHNCESCGISRTWNNKELMFEIDHIDGDISNNYFSNLRCICPNCHSQTETFRAKNIKKKLVP
jgi:endogenous inhibitor of DNA gyrase (YacG/DUF329 family)